jgi:hypothetical protein
MRTGSLVLRTTNKCCVLNRITIVFVPEVPPLTDMYGSTYTLSPPLQDRVFGCFFSPSSFSVAALILLLNKMLSPLFFSNPFLSLDFSLLLCGAVFISARAFNCDLSTWQVGKVTNMYGSTYTLSLSLSKIGSFFTASIYPSSFCGSANSIFEQCSLLFFFQTNFYPWTFLCCCVVQCLSVLLPSMVISPNGRSGK